MSGEVPFGLSFVEKLFGLILALLGVITIYVTLINPPGPPASASSFVFIGVSLALIALGILLILAKVD